MSNIENRLDRLTRQVDKVSTKTHGMLRRSYQLENSSHFLKNQVNKIMRENV